MPAADVNAAAATPIVVVDDDPLFLKTLCANLEDAEMAAVALEGGRAALDYFAKGGNAAAVVLDWQMPEIDGPEVLRRLRAAGNRAPVLFLTGLNQQIYEEAALSGGAVDFVDKSRSFTIILQRLKLAIAGARDPAASPPAGEEASNGPLQLDPRSARAMWRGTQVDLTLTEFKVVQMLFARAGRDVAYREIYDVVHGEGFQAGAGTEGYRANVRTLVKRIRQKFRNIDPSFDALENYPGFGYRWSDAAGS